MKLKLNRMNRDVTTKIHFIIDNFIPPILRDAKWFMYLPFRLFFGKKAGIFFKLKNGAHKLTDKEFADLYKYIDDALPQRETDLNRGCFDQILTSIKGTSVLEVGCGKGALANSMSKDHNVTAVDIIIREDVKKKFPQITFKQSKVESLPFKAKAFDTVVCAHTLEHVQDLSTTIKELRRVCKKRLIIVVPKQRPYKYTFDPHLHFFPYKNSLLMVMGNKNNTCRIVGGDLFYTEEISQT